MAVGHWLKTYFGLSFRTSECLYDLSVHTNLNQAHFAGFADSAIFPGFALEPTETSKPNRKLGVVAERLVTSPRIVV